MDSELAALMPNNMENKEQTSPLDTNELRKYIQENDILEERANLPPQDPRLSRKHYISGLQPGARVSRARQARRFSIRVKRQDTMANAALNDSQLDPEELKDALLQQAIAQRRALVAASLRPGSGRVVKPAPFNIVIELPPVVEEPQNPSPEPSPFAIPGLPNYPSPIEGVLERPPMPAPETIPMPSQSMQAISNNDDDIVIVDDNSPIEGLIHQRAAPAYGGGSVKDMDVDAYNTARAMAEQEIFGTAAGDHNQTTATHNNNNTAYDDDHDDDHNDYGYDDVGGDWGGWDDQDVPPLSSSPVAGATDAFPSSSFQLMPPPPPRQPAKPRQAVRNPGIRLKNELPRKSLALDPHVGLREVAPGIRRSTRQAQEPLKWWLGEKKEFDRVAHKTMPTVKQITQAELNTPWRTVADPRLWKKSRKAYATSHRNHATNQQQAVTKKAATKSGGGGGSRRGGSTTAGGALAKKKRRQMKKKDAGPSSKRHRREEENNNDNVAVDEDDDHHSDNSNSDVDDDIGDVDVPPMPTMDDVVVEGSEAQPIELLDDDEEEDGGDGDDDVVVGSSADDVAVVHEENNNDTANDNNNTTTNDNDNDNNNNRTTTDDQPHTTTTEPLPQQPQQQPSGLSPTPSPSTRQHNPTAVYQNALAEDMIVDDEIILTAAQLPSAPSATPASVTIAGTGRGAVASATPASVTMAMPGRSIGIALQGIMEESSPVDDGDEVEQAIVSISPTSAAAAADKDDDKSDGMVVENAYDDGEIVVAARAVASVVATEDNNENVDGGVEGMKEQEEQNTTNDNNTIEDNGAPVVEDANENDEITAAADGVVVEDDTTTAMVDAPLQEEDNTAAAVVVDEGMKENDDDEQQQQQEENNDEENVDNNDNNNEEEEQQTEKEQDQENEQQQQQQPSASKIHIDDEIIVTERRSLRAKNRSTRR